MEKIDSFSDKYAFMSNFSYSPMTFEGITVPTAEHAFQMMKATTREMMEFVAIAPTASQAKSRGRGVKIRGDWEQIKFDVMYRIQQEKYKQNPYIAAALILTGDAELEEGNWWHDNTWGNCKCERCRDIEGHNMLGNILMKVRGELRNDQTRSI